MTTGGEIEALLRRIGVEFVGLSRQLKLIARYVEQHHEHLAQTRIQDVATRCGVQPSAVVRFAKRFGFSGFNAMKGAFRDDAGSASGASRTYQSRLRATVGPHTTCLSSSDIAFDFIDEAIDGMRLLRRDRLDAALDEAVDLLARANTLWVAGARRSYPVAAYLAYALQHTDKPVQLLTHLGAMHEGQLRGLRRGDTLVAVSFAPYANETALAAQLARSRGAKVVALTDSRTSPLAAEADALILIEEAGAFGFRSLTNTMVLAQGLFIALAYRRERDVTTEMHRVDAGLDHHDVVDGLKTDTVGSGPADDSPALNRRHAARGGH